MDLGGYLIKNDYPKICGSTTTCFEYKNYIKFEYKCKVQRTLHLYVTKLLVGIFVSKLYH
jgi:hypothetical protein